MAATSRCWTLLPRHDALRAQARGLSFGAVTFIRSVDRWRAACVVRYNVRWGSATCMRFNGRAQQCHKAIDTKQHVHTQHTFSELRMLSITYARKITFVPVSS